jgi:all-trans-retinol 13,14-reductase
MALLPWILLGMCVAAVAVAAALYFAVAAAKARPLPRNYSARSVNAADPAYAPAMRKSADVTREAFWPKKVPAEVDYVVIGSGIGSLYCAALLAKAGKKCVVVEQHYVAGGCTHSFHDGGFEFDTGLHYVGRIEKYEELLDFVSTGSKVSWAKMGRESDGYAYDEIKLGSDAPFAFAAGEAAFVENLAREFPEERDALLKYVALCKRVNKLADGYFFAKLFPVWVQRLLNCVANREYFKWARATTWSVVSELTPNPRLRALLCGQWGDYGLKPEDSSFLIQAGIVAHYLGGAYYPVGGSQQISAALIPTIEAAGGKVFVKARVAGIVCESGRAVGVTVQRVAASGEVKEGVAATRIIARSGVISGAGAMVTSALVTPGALRAQLGYDAMFASVGASTSHVYAFVGMRGSGEELGLRGANLWVLPCDGEYRYKFKAVDESDKSEFVPPGSGDPWGATAPDEMLLFMGFPSMKDPSFDARFPGKSTAEIISTGHACVESSFDAISRSRVHALRFAKFAEKQACT